MAELFDYEYQLDEIKTQTNNQLKQLNSANTELNDINTNIAIKNNQLDNLDKDILDMTQENIYKLIQLINITI